MELLQRSFEPVAGDEWSREHSLLGNLATVRETEFDRLPGHGVRTVRDIAHHVGGSYRVYANQGWGDGALHYDRPGLLPSPQASQGSLELWLRSAFTEFIAALGSVTDDADLAALRQLPWGDRRPAGDIARAMLQHTLYHAGEINHLRALLQGDDHWAWDT